MLPIYLKLRAFAVGRRYIQKWIFSWDAITISNPLLVSLLQITVNKIFEIPCSICPLSKTGKALYEKYFSVELGLFVFK